MSGEEKVLEIKEESDRRDRGAGKPSSASSPTDFRLGLVPSYEEGTQRDIIIEPYSGNGKKDRRRGELGSACKKHEERTSQILETGEGLNETRQNPRRS